MQDNKSSGKSRVNIPTPPLQPSEDPDSPFPLDSSATRCKVVMRLKPMQSDAPDAKPKILFDDPANVMPKPANKSDECKLSSDDPAQRLSRKTRFERIRR
jgi:hypothetical protein